MKSGKWIGIVLAAVMLLTCGAWAADPSGQLVKFKTGDVSVTLLQSDGITPMGAAEIKMLAADDSRVLAESVSDRLGQAVVMLTEGRYLLNVSGRTLAVVEAAGDATLTACRVVVPDAALMVAGAEAEEDDDDDTVAAAPLWLKPVVIGGVVVLAGAGGYAIYDHNKDSDDDDATPVPTPTPTPTTKPKAKPEPTPEPTPTPRPTPSLT